MWGSASGQERTLLLSPPRLPAPSPEPNPALTNGDTEAQRREGARQDHPVSWLRRGGFCLQTPARSPSARNACIVVLSTASSPIVWGNFSCHQQAQEPRFLVHQAPTPHSHPQTLGSGEGPRLVPGSVGQHLSPAERPPAQGPRRGWRVASGGGGRSVRTSVRTSARTPARRRSPRAHGSLHRFQTRRRGPETRAPRLGPREPRGADTARGSEPRDQRSPAPEATRGGGYL